MDVLEAEPENFLQGSNLEEQSDSYERFSSENAAESLEQEFDPQLDDEEEEDSQETLGELADGLIYTATCLLHPASAAAHTALLPGLLEPILRMPGKTTTYSDDLARAQGLILY